MRSKLGLPSRIYEAHPTRACQRSTMGKIVLGLLLVMTIASWLHSVPAQAQLQCSKLLCHQPEPDDGKVMIERVCEPNSRALHDRKAGGVDGGQLVQIRASKICPRLLQIAQLAWKNPYRAELVDPSMSARHLDLRYDREM
jgi:hypothetical protein